MKELPELNSRMLSDFKRLLGDRKNPAQIMRQLFKDYGEVGPPTMSDYFSAVYGGRSIDYMQALGSWWHDSTSDISDEEFNRRVAKAISDRQR